MRTFGAYSYREERMKELLKLIKPLELLTINELTSRYKCINPKTHYYTVKSMLERLHGMGLLKFVQVGRVKLWSK